MQLGASVGKLHEQLSVEVRRQRRNKPGEEGRSADRDQHMFNDRKKKSLAGTEHKKGRF